MIEFMNWWVNELWGNSVFALLGVLLLYNVTMLLGRLSMIVMIIVSAITFAIFSTLLWGSWIIVFLFMGSLVYLGYAVMKFFGPPQ